MAMQESQTGSMFCSFYIHCRHQNGENHYTMDTAVGSVRSGDIESLKKGVKLLELNGRDLLGVTSEGFFQLLSGSQGHLSLTIENHGAAIDLPQGDSSNTFEETTLIVTLQDANIDLLCTDGDEGHIVEGTYLFVKLWQCKSIKLVNVKVNVNEQNVPPKPYLGWTASGPGFTATEEKVTMVEMDKHVFLQFPTSKEFLKCEEKGATFTLTAEKNVVLAGLLSAISEREVLKDKDKMEIFGHNKSFFFHLTKKKENVYTFQPALCLDLFISSDGKKLKVRNVPRDDELDAYFFVEANKTKN